MIKSTEKNLSIKLDNVVPQDYKKENPTISKKDLEMQNFDGKADSPTRVALKKDGTHEIFVEPNFSFGTDEDLGIRFQQTQASFKAAADKIKAQMKELGIKHFPDLDGPFRLATRGNREQFMNLSTLPEVRGLYSSPVSIPK